jgi:hypothetical protein
MAGGRDRAQWKHTSTILCYLVEPYRDRRKHPRPYTPNDFNPYAKPRKGRISVEQLTNEIMKIAKSKNPPTGDTPERR